MVWCRSPEPASMSLAPDTFQDSTSDDIHCISSCTEPLAPHQSQQDKAELDTAPRSPHGHTWPHLAIHSTAGGSQLDKSSGEGGCCPLNQGIKDSNTRCQSYDTQG